MEHYFYNELRILDEDLKEDLQKCPKYCLLLAKPFDNVMKIGLFKNKDFINCIAHLQKHHPDRYFTDSARYKIDLTQSGEYHSIIRQMNYLFFVEFVVRYNTVFITVNMLNEDNYRYHKSFTHQCTVELKQEKILVKETPVKRKGMEDIGTLEFKVSDLSIIGDITQTEVFINIENYIACKSCDKIRKYSDGSVIYKCGWRCFKCISPTIRCNKASTDCQTMDCLPKIQKHTDFFCQYQKTCYVCHKKFDESSFHIHYQKHHQDITYPMGEGIWIEASSRYCILQLSVDTLLLVRYHLNSEELFLAIRSPWTSNMLVKYNCFVTVSTHEQKETFQLHPLLHEYDDWRLSVGKWMFKKWNTDTDFIIFVDIRKISSKK